MDPETFKETMVRHIMNGSRDTYAVTPEDDARIRELARKKFNSWDRIFGADPQFNIERTALQGEKFNLKSRSGRVSSAAPRFTATFFPLWTRKQFALCCWAAATNVLPCWRRLSPLAGPCTASRRRK